MSMWSMSMPHMDTLRYDLAIAQPEPMHPRTVS